MVEDGKIDESSTPTPVAGDPYAGQRGTLLPVAAEKENIVAEKTFLNFFPHRQGQLKNKNSRKIIEEKRLKAKQELERNPVAAFKSRVQWCKKALMQAPFPDPDAPTDASSAQKSSNELASMQRALNITHDASHVKAVAILIHEEGMVRLIVSIMNDMSLSLETSLIILRILSNVLNASLEGVNSRINRDDLMELLCLAAEFYGRSIAKLRDRTNNSRDGDKETLLACEMFCLRILVQMGKICFGNGELQKDFLSNGGLHAVLLGMACGKGKEARTLRAAVADYPPSLLEQIRDKSVSISITAFMYALLP